MAERVYSYFDYDGEVELPWEGVADFAGMPHYFWLHESSSTPRSGFFDLAPVDDTLLSRVVEMETIWHAWDLDYHAGKVALDSHPFRTGVAPQFVNLQIEISNAAYLLREAAFRRYATFRATEAFLALAIQFEGKRWPIPGFHSATLEVCWLDS